MPDVVDAQLRLQFLGRDVTLPSHGVMASDPAHDPNIFQVPVEALKKPHVLSTSNPLAAFPSHTKAARARATHKQSS